MSVILIADDDPNLRYSFQRMLDGKGYAFIEAEDGLEAVEKVRGQRPDVVVLDVRMPRMDGMEAFEEIKRITPRTPVIIMTAYGTTEIAIEAMKRGAFDYVLKPFNVDEMCDVLSRALKSVEQGAEVESLSAEVGAPAAQQLVGTSRAMQRVYKAIGQVAESDVHVLIQGESGTGKELVARAIHTHSKRSERPFIAINCAAIPENLIESELFGHEKGAFTGAVDRKAGLLQSCDKGTVFLDEIVELPLPAQAKLLRFLQEGEVIRLGGNAPINLDVRVIAASNIDLEQAVVRKQFREDLFFRLNMMSIVLPPLKERLEDLDELVAHFVAMNNERYGKSFTQISSEVIQLLRERSWPGNVRELENMVRKAVIVGRGDILLKEHIFPDSFIDPVDPGGPMGPELERSIGTIIDQLVDAFSHGDKPPLIPAMERIFIARVLERVKGNQVKAARLLGISRNTLRNRIEKYGLRQSLAVTVDSPEE